MPRPWSCAFASGGMSRVRSAAAPPCASRAVTVPFESQATAALVSINAVPGVRSRYPARSAFSDSLEAKLQLTGLELGRVDHDWLAVLHLHQRRLERDDLAGGAELHRPVEG